MLGDFAVSSLNHSPELVLALGLKGEMVELRRKKKGWPELLLPLTTERMEHQMC